MIPVIDGPRLGALVPVTAAIAALRDALRDGAPTSTGPARLTAPARSGHLLLMPAENHELLGIKIIGVAPGNPARGLPRITGTYLLHDATTLQPRAVIDGAALTLIRTAALSALAVDEIADRSATRMLLYGTGPQAQAHIEALATVRTLDDIAVSGRTVESTAAFVHRLTSSFPVRAATEGDVAGADLIACCTSSSTPLFDGRLVAPDTTVVAMGSHTLDSRELDAETMRRSTVVVEDSDAALREAADVVEAIRCGDITELVPLADVITGSAIDRTRTRVFRSVGMAWEDLAVAEAALGAHDTR